MLPGPPSLFHSPVVPSVRAGAERVSAGSAPRLIVVARTEKQDMGTGMGWTICAMNNRGQLSAAQYSLINQLVWKQLHMVLHPEWVLKGLMELYRSARALEQFQHNLRPPPLPPVPFVASLLSSSLSLFLPSCSPLLASLPLGLLWRACAGVGAGPARRDLRIDPS